MATDSSYSTGLSEDVTSTSSTDSAMEIIEAAVARSCGQFVECGCGELDGAWYTSLEGCIAQEQPQMQGVIDFGAEAGLTFDPECFEARFDRYYRLACESDWSAAGPRVECNLHYGTVSLGETCTRYDNAEGDDCTRGLHCWSGVCVELKAEYGVGESCYKEHPYCVDGAMCLDLDNDGSEICEPLPLVGEPCIYACAPGLLCTAESVCSAAPGLGEPCGPPDAECDACLSCDGQAEPPTCVLPASEPGESCRSDRDCIAGAWCRDIGACSADPVVCWSGTDSVPVSRWEDALCRGV
jgi:hypothetical protein